MLKITKLDNGLRVVTQNMPGLETVSMGIWNAVGGRDEVEANNGVAHLLEHMAFKGTLTKNALQIAETIEDVGGDINAYTSKEITAYYVKLLADDLHYGVDILTDILQNSAFAEDELNRERGVIIQEIGMYLDTPDDMIFDYWQEKAFPNQPMGRSILGKTDIIKNISREEVKGFMSNHYNPNKMIISAAGKINHDAFVEMIKKSCTNLPVGCSNNPDYLIKKGQVGKVNNETLVKELDSIFLNDSIVKRIGEGDYMFSGDDKYLIFNSKKEHLLSLTPKQQHDINERIETIEIISDKFKTIKGISSNSSFGDIKKNLTISDIQNTINNIVVFVDEIDAYFIIDKKNLPLEFRLGTSKKIQAINIPSSSKIKRFMIGWD